MTRTCAWGTALALCLAPAPALAQIVEPTFYGGAGDQRGTSIAISGGALYVAGQGSPGNQGVVVKYALPPGAPVWSQPAPASPTGFGGVAVQDTHVFAAGSAFPPACGASDGVGGTEDKVGLTRLQTGGTGAVCQSANFFPYRGGEGFAAAVPQVETGTPYFYLIGSAENCGFGHTLHILAKYTAAGVLANWVTEQPSPGCIGGSYGYGITAHGGFLYVAAHSQLVGAGEDNVARPVVMKYDNGLTRMWKRRNATIAGVHQAVAVVDGFVYAVGYSFFPGGPNSEQFLVEKYDLDGNFVWSQVSGGDGPSFLTGVVGLRGRVFAVGFTHAQGSGGADAAILEIDPASGATRSTTLFGGNQNDMARGVVTDGTDLYVVGESRSFATPEGNLAGQNDLVLLRVVVGDGFYTVAPCRAGDTRDPDGPRGGPPLSHNSTRLFPAAGICTIPPNARAIAINVTVVGATDLGNLRVYPAGQPEPNASTINFGRAAARANNAIVPLGTDGQIAVKCDLASPGTTHFLFDITGYFQ